MIQFMILSGTEIEEVASLIQFTILIEARDRGSSQSDSVHVVDWIIERK